MKYSLKNRNKSVTRLLLFGAIVSTVLVMLAIFGVRYAYNQNLKAVSGSERVQLITVPSGASAQDVGVLLKQAGLIKQAWAFEWYIRNNNLRDSIQAGTYALRQNMGIVEIVKVVTKGEVATDLFTILPGQRIDQVRQALLNAGYTAKQVDAALSPAQYKNHPALVDKPATANLEGYLYPESFQKTATTKPEELIKASLDEMQKRLTPDIRSAFARQKLTVYEGVILASIIEQEVSKAEDKAKVAQVFLLRREKGMEFGSDPTAFYGALLAGQEPTVFHDSPYNTRKYTGFPPGPISNVSQASLEAVANPAGTDYLYFVAGDDGITHFSHTLQEHEALTAKYCKKLCSQ
jgi:UPF0755 protein